MDLLEVDAVYAAQQGNPKPLADWIRSGKPLSQDARDVVADLLEGKVKGRPGRPRVPVWFRRGVAEHIALEMAMGYPLNPSREREGAAARVAARFSISEEAARKHYQEFASRIDRELLREAVAEYRGENAS